MAFPPKQLLILLFYACLFRLSHTLDINCLLNPLSAITDVHDFLTQYGLPKGLLPDVVKSYSHADDGFFTVEHSTTCYVQFADLVLYDKTITGKLIYRKISDIRGIQILKFLTWLSVTGIDADADSSNLVFHEVLISQPLPAWAFRDIHPCRRHLSISHQVQERAELGSSER